MLCLSITPKFIFKTSYFNFQGNTTTHTPWARVLVMFKNQENKPGNAPQKTVGMLRQKQEPQKKDDTKNNFF